MKVSQSILIFFLAGIGLVSCKYKSATSFTDAAIYHEPSIEPYTQKIMRSPDEAALYFDRGRALCALGVDSVGLLDFKQACQLDSTNAIYFSVIGDLLFEHKDISGSVQWLQKAIQLDPEDPVAHLKIAKMFVFLKEYNKAFAEINTVLKKDVYNPEAYFLKGVIYKNAKDTNHAISSFQTAVQVQPNYTEAIDQLGLLYAAQKNDLCLKYFQNSFKIDTSNVFPLFAIANYYQAQGAIPKAKEYYQQCIYKDNQYTNAYFNLGWLLMQEDSLEKASRQFDIITMVEPTNAEAYYNRGLCKELMKKYAEAQEDYQQALVFDAKNKNTKEAIQRIQHFIKK